MPRTKEPTARQMKVLKFVTAYCLAHIYGPSLKEIGEAAGITERSSVRATLTSLVGRGLLRKAPWDSRDYYPTEKGRAA